MGKSKLLGTLGKLATAALTPTILEEGTKLANDFIDRRKGYVKIPDVTKLDTQEAHETVDKYNFNHSTVKARANANYANAIPGTIVKVEPKPNTLVSPDTFVKLYYIDEPTIEESKQLAQEQAERKAQRKQARKDQVQHAVHATSKVANNLSKKVHLKKSFHAGNDDQDSTK
ncbi:PASTA domain-containing protein [Lactobacillaceae bacterium L1_55_11]|nr:PASTA domain-containing protein [Lactobacillaceae bacterium L1_55_11]